MKPFPRHNKVFFVAKCRAIDCSFGKIPNGTKCVACNGHGIDLDDLCEKQMKATKPMRTLAALFIRNRHEQ